MGAVGLSGVAAFSLTLTAVSPVLAVWLCTYYEEWQWRAPAAAAALVLFLLIFCQQLLSHSRKSVQHEPLTLVSSAIEDKQTVGFLVAYAMPLLAGPGERLLAPLFAFTLFLFILVWRTQMVHVNPLASLLGYHFFKAQAASGREYLIISRQWHLSSMPIQVVRLSQTLFLDVSEADR